MFAYSCRIALAAVACALTAPALAQTLTNKDISADIAVTIATTAMADCKTKGYKVSGVVVGRVGEIIVQVRGDGTGPDRERRPPGQVQGPEEVARRSRRSLEIVVTFRGRSADRVAFLYWFERFTAWRKGLS